MNQLIAMTLATTIVGLPIVIFAWWLVRHHDKEKAKWKKKQTGYYGAVARIISYCHVVLGWWVEV